MRRGEEHELIETGNLQTYGIQILEQADEMENENSDGSSDSVWGSDNADQDENDQEQ